MYTISMKYIKTGAVILFLLQQIQAMACFDHFCLIQRSCNEYYLNPSLKNSFLGPLLIQTEGSQRYHATSAGQKPIAQYNDKSATVAYLS